MRKEHGFTVLEVVVALVVLGVGLMGVAAMMTKSIQGNIIGCRMTQGSDVAAAWMEWMLKQPYEKVAALDTNPDDTAATQRSLNPDTLLGDLQTWGLGTFSSSQVPKLAGTWCSIIWRVMADVPEDNMTTIEIETQVAIRQTEAANGGSVNKPVLLRFIMAPYM